MLEALQAGDGTCDLAVAGVDISRINLEKARAGRAGQGGRSRHQGLECIHDRSSGPFGAVP